MKKNDCSECSKEFPMDDLYYYKDKAYCSNCIGAFIGIFLPGLIFKNLL